MLGFRLNLWWADADWPRSLAQRRVQLSMSTRITGGKDRGRKLRSAKATGLRPTSERVRGAIFSMIGRNAVEGMRILDLYAGTGSLGIEALSRGASWADFVEAHAGRCQEMREALRELGFAAHSHVYRARVEKALDVVDGGYDLVLIDPPYDLDPWDVLMDLLNSSQLVTENALVVAEHRHQRQLAETYGRLVRAKSKRYGDTAVSVYKAGPSDG